MNTKNTIIFLQYLLFWDQFFWLSDRENCHQNWLFLTLQMFIKSSIFNEISSMSTFWNAFNQLLLLKSVWKWFENFKKMTWNPYLMGLSYSSVKYFYDVNLREIFVVKKIKDCLSHDVLSLWMLVHDWSVFFICRYN